MIRTKTEIRVRYVETDAMGFVHHANYLPWLELARIEMLDQLGLPYRDLEKDGYRLPVLGVNIRYKKPSYFDDRVKIICFVKDLSGLRLTIEYEVYRDDTLLCTASTDHAFINASGQPVRPPKAFTELFKQALGKG